MESMSLLNFFRYHKLNNEFYICYNSDNLSTDLYYPIYERFNEYKYYIPLLTPIRGYNRIVVSTNAANYIVQHVLDLDLNRLRISFYPWPEIILVSHKYLKNGYYDERDSIDDVNIRLTFVKDYTYENLVPTYKNLIFKGIKTVTEFKPENPPIRHLNDMTYEEEGYIFNESNNDESEDAYYSGEYLPEDW